MWTRLASVRAAGWAREGVIGEYSSSRVWMRREEGRENQWEEREGGVLTSLDKKLLTWLTVVESVWVRRGLSFL